MVFLKEIYIPLCIKCKLYNAGNICIAFPEGIPDEIITGDHDHRTPHPGDNGITFVPIDAQ